MLGLLLAAAENAPGVQHAAGAEPHSGPVAPPQIIASPFGLDITSEITTQWFVMALLVIVSILATRNMKLIPGKLQSAVEMVFNFLVDGVIAPSIGGREKALRYLPLLGTIFLFIITSNYLGLLPGAVLHIRGFKPPTSALMVTSALAVIAFFATHYAGFRERGVHYVQHLFQPFWWLFPMNLIEEVIRPVSLALRLFGNIFGGETILWVLLSLVPWFIPIPIMGLEVFFGFLQAFIFTTLTAVYIGAATADSH